MGDKSPVTEYNIGGITVKLRPNPTNQIISSSKNYRKSSGSIGSDNCNYKNFHRDKNYYNNKYYQRNNDNREDWNNNRNNEYHNYYNNNYNKFNNEKRNTEEKNYHHRHHYENDNHDNKEKDRNISDKDNRRNNRENREKREFTEYRDKEYKYIDKREDSYSRENYNHHNKEREREKHHSHRKKNRDEYSLKSKSRSLSKSRLRSRSNSKKQNENINNNINKRNIDNSNTNNNTNNNEQINNNCINNNSSLPIIKDTNNNFYYLVMGNPMFLNSNNNISANNNNNTNNKNNTNNPITNNINNLKNFSPIMFIPNLNYSNNNSNLNFSNQNNTIGHFYNNKTQAKLTPTNNSPSNTFSNLLKDNQVNPSSTQNNQEEEPSNTLLITEIDPYISKDILEDVFREKCLDLETSLPIDIHLIEALNSAYIIFPSVSVCITVYNSLPDHQISINSRLYPVQYSPNLTQNRTYARDSMTYVTEVETKEGAQVQTSMETTVHEDWYCVYCDFKNFCKRQVCFKCQRPKTLNCRVVPVIRQKKTIIGKNGEILPSTSLIVIGSQIKVSDEGEVFIYYILFYFLLFFNLFFLLLVIGFV